MSDDGDGFKRGRHAAERRKRAERRDAAAAVVAEAQPRRVAGHAPRHVGNRADRARERGRAASTPRREGPGQP